MDGNDKPDTELNERHDNIELIGPRTPPGHLLFVQFAVQCHVYGSGERRKREVMCIIFPPYQIASDWREGQVRMILFSYTKMDHTFVTSVCRL